MGQITDTKRREVYEKLEESLLRGENKSYRQYSKELGIKKDTVGKYIQEIIANTPRRSLEEVEFRIEKMYDRIIGEAEMMLDFATSIEEKEKSIKLLLLCHDKFIDFLERFGLKAKAAETLNINQEVNHTINYNQQRSFVSNLDKQLEGITDEKKRQEIVINLLDNQENETKSQ